MVPPPPRTDGNEAIAAPRAERPATHRSGYRCRSELLKRTFAIDAEQCACGGRLKLVRLVTRKQTIEKLHPSLGEPTDAPGLAPARGPPFRKNGIAAIRFLARSDRVGAGAQRPGSIAFRLS